MGTELDIDDVCAGNRKAEQELKTLRAALRDCRDMLNESAKQFRQLDQTEFATMCEKHAQVADDIASA